MKFISKEGNNLINIIYNKVNKQLQVTSQFKDENHPTNIRDVEYTPKKAR